MAYEGLVCRALHRSRLKSFEEGREHLQAKRVVWYSRGLPISDSGHIG